MDPRGDGDLVELFYEAAVRPSLWPTVLERLADRVSGSGAAILSADRPEGLWVRVDPAARAVFDQRYRNRNPFADYKSGLVRRGAYRPAVSIDQQIISRDDLHRTDFFNEFMRPYDGDGMILVDLGVRQISAAVNICRTPRARAFDEEDLRVLQRLQADLTRAFWLTIKLGLSEAVDENLVAVLERSDQGFLLLNSSGHINYANPPAAAALAERNGLVSALGRLTAETGADRARLEAAIGVASRGTGGVRKADWLAVRRRPPAPPMKVAIAPLRDKNFGLFEPRSSVIVCLADGRAKGRLSLDQLRALYDLTPAQAQFALRLLDGADLNAASHALGISANTARVHLREVFAKTRTNRQSELVQLLTRMGLQSLV